MLDIILNAKVAMTQQTWNMLCLFLTLAGGQRFFLYM